MSFTRAELERLDIACRHWAKARGRWAAFSTFHHLAGVTTFEYQPPGRRPAKRVSAPFKGKGVFRPRREEIGPGVQVVAQIWHVGEACGDPKGEQIGLVYRLGEKMTLRAERTTADVRRGRACLELEEGEEQFIHLVLDKLRRSRARARARRRRP